MSKKRIEIPPGIAARILFRQDRTCCVCRVKGKAVQIHHLDEDPSNFREENLAVLCLDCHRETQIRGGFDRKLDADQVILYREDWIRLVVQSRAQEEAVREAARPEADLKVKIATSVAEVYLEHKEYELLAIHYHVLNQPDLRDKYIGLALRKSPTDYMVAVLRGIQGRPELIPKQVIKRELRRCDRHAFWNEKARFLRILGRTREAAESYVAGVLGCLREGNTFAAAFYLKELFATGLTERLFEFAFEEARRDGQLWWQVRALQELDRQAELHSLLLDHAKEIESSADPNLLHALAHAQKDPKEILKAERHLAEESVWLRSANGGRSANKPLKPLVGRRWPPTA